MLTVNFGLATKKSIIHPRSDSSNRSTRFSLSSEKSYPNGLCTPGQAGYVANCPHARETIINDDIEKRVLVNKDGSLSVEMKVRFRLGNDETLQWSTEIKKSPGTTNDTINEKEANPHYLLQGKESSEQESSGEVEEAYAEKSHCGNSCNHCQEYDIWKNPMHRQHHRSSRHIKSSSSSASSHKIVCKEASVDSIRTISRSSEEYTEHVVEKASCYQQTLEGGDTMVEYCTISRCCSRSEVCSMATTSKSKRSHPERCEGESRMVLNGEKRPHTPEWKHRHSGVCCVEVTKASDAEDRPVSAVSNSSKVLESLKEDQDDDFDDIPPSASRASQCSQGELEESSRAKSRTKTPDQRSEVSACSARSLKHKVKNTSPAPADQQQNSPIPNARPKSTASRSSSKCHSCHCGAASPQSTASNTPENAEEGDRPQSTVSKSSRTSKESCKSHKDRSHSSGSQASNTLSAKDEGQEEEEEEERTLSAMSEVSKGSGKSSVCPHCGVCDGETESAPSQSEKPTDKIEDNQSDDEAEEKPPSVRSTSSAASVKSEKSSKSTKCEHHVSSRGATPLSDKAEVESNGGVEAVPNDRVESALSNHSNASAVSTKSNRSACSNCRRSSLTESVAVEEKSGNVSSEKESVEEERVGSSMSNKSMVSHKSNCSTSNRAKTPRSNHSGSPAPITDDVEGRDGAASAQSNTSRASRMSRKSQGGEVKRAESQASVASEQPETEEAPAERSASVMSSSKQASMEEKPGTDEAADDKTVNERATSAMSNRTDASVKSHKSHKSHKSNCSTSKRAKSPAPQSLAVTEVEEEIEKRADSAMSARSNISAASGRSARPQSKASERAASQASAVSETCQQETEAPKEEENSGDDTAKAAEEPVEESRAPSVVSNASGRSRASHKSACSTSSRAKSPRAATPAKVSESNGKSAERETTCDPEPEAVAEERAASVMSNKTDASVKSKISTKSVLPAPERAKSPRPKSPARVKQEEKENEAENRPASSLSVKSDVSRTSRRSKRAASPANHSAPEERPTSAMSRKSAKSSPKTNEETIAEEKAPSETSVKDDASNHETTEPSAEGGEEKEERAASAMSNKTDATVKSRVSHKSTLHAPDKAQTARAKSPAPSDRTKEGKSEKRPLSSLSVGTDASRSSRKSQDKEAKRSPSPAAKQHGGQETEVASKERPTSAMSKKSTKSSKNQPKEENEVQENVASASLSPETHSNDPAEAEDTEQRPESVMSHASDKQSLNGAPERATTPAEPTDPPAGQEVKLVAEEVNERSKSALSVASHTSKKSVRAPSPRPKTSQSKTSKAEEEPRASSAMSGNSKVSSKSKKCQCNHSKDTTPKTPPENAEEPSTPDATAITTPEPDEAREEPEGPTTIVTPDTEAPSEQKRAESVKSTRSSTKSKAGCLKVREDKGPVTRSKSPAPAKAEEPSADSQTEDTGAGKEGNDNRNEKAASMTLRDSRPKSSASVRSTKSTKSHKDTKTNDGSKQASYLDVKGPITEIDGKSDNGSVKSVKSTRKAKSVKFDKDPEEEKNEEKAPRPNSGAASDASQNCSSPAQEQPNKNKPPTIRLAATSSDSDLSNALSAADLLRELSGNTRPGSRISQWNVEVGENDKLEIKSNRSSKHKKVSSSQRDDQSSLELVQSCLPNASPNDVVNEWLKNISANGPMYEMEDELVEPEDLPREESLENAEDLIQNAEENADEHCEEKEDTDACNETATQAEESNAETVPPKPNSDAPQKQHLPRHSSVQVMNALLSPKLDRCNSLPEVSPVYGRKLSRSAIGLLDCLAKLRLIDSDHANTQNAKYSEIMSILQTLWLYEPTEEDQKTQRGKDHAPGEDEANPRSSSGVDVSSGSAESTKSAVHNGVEKAASAPPTLIVEQPSGLEEEAEGETPAETAPEEGADAPEQTAESDQEEDVSDPATPDVATRVQGSQEDDEKSDEADAEHDVPEGVAESAESLKEDAETVESPNVSSGKDSRSANETESDPPEYSSSGTPPSVQQVQLSRKVSLDPDPTWVLSLLKKIEKQFMSHYASAMAEFKVRWDLDDNVMLDTMINELKVEVHKRIQDSIKRELQKIQGRAGRSPRPPVGDLSKEFSVQTEQRRRRLKVMRNRSLKPSKSADIDIDIDAASGTDFSDQRSEDEYCPCEACMRKKLEATEMIRAELIHTAPVRMDFDLRKILQVKRDPPPAPKVEPPSAEQSESQPETELQQHEEEDGNLEVVQEEPEQEDAPEEINVEEGGEEPNEAGESVDVEAQEEEGGDDEETVTGEGEDEREETEEMNENLETEEGEDEQGAEEEVAEVEAGQEVDEADKVNDEDDDGDDQDEVAEVADGSGEEDDLDNEADQQLSKDGTEDEEAIAEKIPMDDTEGDVDGKQGDSSEALEELEEDGLDDEVRIVCDEDETEEAEDAEGDATVQSDTNEEAQDQDEGEDEDEAEEETAVVDIKAAGGETWEKLRNRQMTRTSVESQTGSMDSMELELEAKQIVQSVFSSIHGHKIDRDETDEGLKTTSKKRSRSPARANKSRRPKDSDIKVD